ncbi:MAG: PPC domain-containing protein, partial [Planctomycetia bacterium]|nr:PPC domain-containing protein [Planctomycetia bacterium]
GLPSDATFIDGFSQFGLSALTRRVPGNVVKQEEDLVRIIGHTIGNAGPLGFDGALQGDQFGDVASRQPALGTAAARGFSNVHEGVYIDDIVIGFAERGEMATDASTDSTFVNNPDLSANQVLTGAYQVEIRKATDFGVAVPPGSTRASLVRSFDTNDRLTQGLTIIAQPGANIYDGQTFVLSNGVASVTFEYDDTTIGNGILTGRHAVPFTPASTNADVARAIRDAINSNTVQAVIPNISAGLADGTLVGAGTPTVTTTNRVNVYGPAHLTVHALDVDETNDFLAEAAETGIIGRNSPAFLASGAIGDNQREPIERGLDVDLFRIQLFRGETIRIDVDAEEIGSALNPLLRVFDAFGNQLAINDNRIAPSETSRRLFFDPYIEFTAPASGTYFVGVSGSSNANYDPNVEGSGTNSGIGFYQLEMTFGAVGAADFTLFDDPGDSNLFRDQGQIVIEGNRIADSSGFGILVDAGQASTITTTSSTATNGITTITTGSKRWRCNATSNAASTYWRNWRRRNSYHWWWHGHYLHSLCRGSAQPTRTQFGRARARRGD